MRSWSGPTCTTRRRRTTRRSGRTRRPNSSTGSSPGTRRSTGSSPTPLVRRRHAQRVVQLPRPARVAGQRRPGRVPLGRRTRRHPHDHLRRTARRGAAFANVLKSLGIEQGDRVNIYLPMIPEAAVAMLACARIGAPHSVVFGGFSAQSLADRINDAEAKVLITADGGYRRGSVFPLKAAADEACESTPSIEHVVVVQARWQRRRDGRRARPLVPRPHGRRLQRLSGRSDGRRAAALPALHLGHDRQAEGHHAHLGRLPHPRRLHPQVRVRPPSGDRRVLVHRRRRLGHRPQLHRVRPTRQRRDAGDVRGGAEPSRPTTGSGRSSRSTA